MLIVLSSYRLPPLNLTKEETGQEIPIEPVVELLATDSDPQENESVELVSVVPSIEPDSEETVNPDKFP